MFAVEMKHITKRFGTLTANSAVDLTVERGSIHALVGENGAGKSTLMNLLYGLYRPDSGEIFINEKRTDIENPATAIKLGVGMVHQHFMLVPPLTVAENIILGCEPTRKPFMVDRTTAKQSICRLSEAFSLKIDPETKIENLSVGLQQRVEILKVLYRNADILILDEPTPVLTPQEVNELFQTLRDLKAKGKTVILITHKLNEVMAISDAVTILRHGKHIARVETHSTTKETLARLMVGKDIEPKIRKSQTISGEPIVSAKSLSALNDRKTPTVKNISFAIHSGEILGIAGVEGNGQTELVEILTGLRKHTSGRIELNGKEVHFLRDRPNVAHIPEDRLKRGIILEFSLTENLLLGRQREAEFYNRFFISKEKLSKYSDDLIQKFDIRPSNKAQKIRGFSGGNQQKAVVARELEKNALFIVASQPTRGLDIMATNFVHDSLLAERNNGKAILLISSDLEELLALSDRIAVMYEGEIVATLSTNDTSEYELGEFMTGAKRKSA
jgi:general nucleoside transport system ATP-binding protein